MTRVLMELMPCLDGYAGIPQDTRITFDMLSQVPQVKLGGLLLDNGAGTTGFRSSLGNAVEGSWNNTSRYIVSIENPGINFSNTERSLLLRIIDAGRVGAHAMANYLGLERGVFPLEVDAFDDYFWQRLFAKSLSVESKKRALDCDFYGCSISAHQMYACTSMSLPNLSLNTRAFDTVIVQKPFNASVSDGTRFLVRYHDAIPVTHPHTIADSRLHQQVHYRGLRRNVSDGAEFVCNSHSTRTSLLGIFPELESRSHVVHCAVPDSFYPDRDIDLEKILIRRMNFGLVDGLSRYRDVSDFSTYIHQKLSPDYFVSVGTMEPRKNYASIITAWERYRNENGKDVKLVLVANPGWSSDPILQKLKRHLSNGDAFILTDVPLYELRKLYTNAKALIVASVSEGFSFSGVEAMKCGAQVIASDIPCHREIYGSEVHYFNPYASAELMEAMRAVDGMDDNATRQWVESNISFAQRYSTEAVGKAWRELI